MDAPAGGASGASEIDSERGIIEGTTTDEEVRPIDNVTIAILDLDIQVLTGPDGRFRIPDVPIGQYPIIATKEGYESQAKSVQVVYAEASKVSFIMSAIPTEEPFIELFPHVAIHHVGAFLYTTWAANYTGQSALCSGCVWLVKTKRPPDGFVLEIYGRHSVPSVVRPEQEHFWMFSLPNRTGIYECQNAYQDLAFGGEKCRLPIVLRLDKWRIGDNKGFFIEIMCDLYWFCLEEKREIWTTLFHNSAEIPANYTAKPR